MERQNNMMTVEVWSDIMCPFCYLGKRRFEQALEMFPVWRSSKRHLPVGERRTPGFSCRQQQEPVVLLTENANEK